MWGYSITNELQFHPIARFNVYRRNRGVGFAVDRKRHREFAIEEPQLIIQYHILHNIEVGV